MAAKAKIWNNEPAGRCRHKAITSEHAPATTVVAATCVQVLAASDRPSACPARADNVAKQDHEQHEGPARTWMKSRLRCSSPRP